MTDEEFCKIIVREDNCIGMDCDSCPLDIGPFDCYEYSDTTKAAEAWLRNHKQKIGKSLEHGAATDPKKSAGSLKCQKQLLSTVAMTACANVIALGAEKYGQWNWRSSDGVEAMTYVGAIRRHLDQWVDGEDVDAESGESHVAHIMATCNILLDAERVGKLIDNRPKLEA